MRAAFQKKQGILASLAAWYGEIYFYKLVNTSMKELFSSTTGLLHQYIGVLHAVLLWCFNSLKGKFLQKASLQ